MWEKLTPYKFKNESIVGNYLFQNNVRNYLSEIVTFCDHTECFINTLW